MLNMNQIFSVKISRELISADFLHNGRPVGNSGFTLLELIISMTIISMVVLVLYFAFSIGARSWNDDSLRAEKDIRLEAVLRLVEDDLQNVVPYDMNWERGRLSVFTGGPGTVFYVTGNGTGAFAGAGAGLFFSILYVDTCPETTEDCLLLYKSSRPSPEFVRAVYNFKSSSEIQREHFAPGMEIANKSLLILEGVEGFNISYSMEKFIPFAGAGHEAPESRMSRDGALPDKFWVAQETPGQVRVAFGFEDRDFVVYVPVGSW